MTDKITEEFLNHVASCISYKFSLTEKMFRDAIPEILSAIARVPQLEAYTKKIEDALSSADQDIDDKYKEIQSLKAEIETLQKIRNAVLKLRAFTIEQMKLGRHESLDHYDILVELNRCIKGVSDTDMTEIPTE